MSQLAISAVLTNGSPTVTVVGEDLTAVVHAGYVLAVTGEAACYSLAIEPSYAGGNTTLTLTGNYAGTSGTKAARLVVDYTSPDLIPLIKPGDLDTGRIFTESMLRIQELLTTYGLSVGGSPLLNDNNLSDLVSVPTARSNLGLSAAATMTPAAIVDTLTAAQIATALGAAAWNATNDGAGSGLDADLLDGQHGAYYRDASNINAGLLGVARMGTGTADGTKVLYGDGTWRTVADGGIGFDAVDSAGDTMNGDLGFASGKKIAMPDEWGVKWQLKAADAYVEAVLASTSIDFVHGGGLTAWRFMAGVDERLKVSAEGLRIGGYTTLRSPALGQLELHDGALPHTLALYHLFSGGGVDWEGLKITSDVGGASLFSGAGGTGTPRSIAIGTLGDAELTFFTNATARWAVNTAGHLIPSTDLVADIGETGARVRDIHLQRQILSTSIGTPALSTPGDPDTGVALPANGQIDMMVDASTVARFSSLGMELAEELGVKFNNALQILRSTAAGRIALIPTASGGNNPRLKVYQSSAQTDDMHVWVGFNDAGTAAVVRAESVDGGDNTFPLVAYGSQVDLTTPNGGWQVDTDGDLVPSASNAMDVGSATYPVADLHLAGVLRVASEIQVNGARAAYFEGTHDDLGAPSPLLLGMRAGRKLALDEEFATGNNGVTAHEGGAGGSCVLLRDNTAISNPNATGYYLQFTQTWPSSGTHEGGFNQPATARANAVFVQQFTARLPVGYSFALVSTNLGTEGKSFFMGNAAGTGKWETYTVVWMCGTTPVANPGRVQVTGGAPSEVLVWYVASSTIFDVTQRVMDAELLGGQPKSYFTNASNLDAGTVPTARLGSGTADATTILYGNGTWATPASGVYFGVDPPVTSEKLWWNTEDGNLKVKYDDGDTTQWVDACSGIKGDPGASGVAPSGTGFVHVTGGVLDTPAALTFSDVTTGLGYTPGNLAGANSWTAMQTFRAGAAGAGTAPIKLQSGAVNTVAEVGAIEFLTDKIYFTITTGAARKEIALCDNALTITRIPYVGTNGRLTDTTALTWDYANQAFLIGGQAFNAGYTLENNWSSNGNSSIANRNRSTGTGAFGGFYAYNSGANGAALVKLGTGYTTSGLLAADDQLLQGTGGKLVIGNLSAADVVVATGGSATTNERLRADANGNVTVGNAALATNATNGFFYIPTCAGVPTGVPTSKTGRVAMIYDTVNNNFYIYNGGWKKTTTFA